MTPARPVFVRLPAQFGQQWVNPHRIDSISILPGGRTSTVTIRVREQRITTLDTVTLTPDRAADVVGEVFRLIRGEPSGAPA